MPLRYTRKAWLRFLSLGEPATSAHIPGYFLQKHGYSVIVVDNLSRGHRDAVPEDLLHVMDIRETDKLAELLTSERVDAVVHFAAFIEVGESTRVPELFYANNVGGSAALFEAMLRAGVKRVVFSSTAASYGIPEKVPITEDEPSAPINPYGDSKAIVERILESLDRYRGFPKHPPALFQCLRRGA